MKTKLLISFSGGETSAFMSQWLWNHMRDKYEMLFVFANTGQENEETLTFIRDCELFFGFPITWVEALVNPEFGIGTRHTIVDFNSASRDGQPFENMIAKYGIPNIANPQCTRELKEAPIHSFAKEYFGTTDFYTAIGIRNDEVDRISAKAKKRKLIYPLISKDFKPTTKPVINLYWSGMPFRLNLKGYQGNCKWCWKKSKNKLLRIAKDNPEHFTFPASIELKYGNYFPPHRKEKYILHGKEIPFNITFFRGGVSAKTILLESISVDPIISDDSIIYNSQGNIDFENDIDLIGGESCEVFSECGN